MNRIIAYANSPHLLPRGTVTPWASVKEALDFTSAEMRRTSNDVCAIWAQYRAEGRNPAWARAQTGFRAAQQAADRASRAHDNVCTFAARYRGWRSA